MIKQAPVHRQRLPANRSRSSSSSQVMSLPEAVMIVSIMPTSSQFLSRKLLFSLSYHRNTQRSAQPNNKKRRLYHCYSDDDDDGEQCGSGASDGKVVMTPTNDNVDNDNGDHSNNVTMKRAMIGSWRKVPLHPHIWTRSG